ncbi:glycoside hydrolase family 9 protein [Ruania rhizosphaerae]|uniref:glycoside hydrolase family 9 protein n=1 Tax=Ruania rhizosphaerae TaxID=1840413 RepID=UPI00135953DF|nr:glycoside hydrolase family 9 protein [Ruania rhizosphaerae]
MHRRTRLSSVLALLLAVAMLTSWSAPAQAEEQDLIVNGSFDETHEPWWATANVAYSVSSAGYCAQVPGGVQSWEAIVGQRRLPVVDGADYTLRFTAWADAPSDIRAQVQPTENPDLITYLAQTVSLSTAPTTYEFPFTATVPAGVTDSTLQLRLGGSASDRTICFSNVELVTEIDESPPLPPIGDDEILLNGTFDESHKPWWVNGGMEYRLDSGGLCIDVPPSENPWDLLLGQNSLHLLDATGYRLSLRVRTSVPVEIGAQVQPFDNPDNLVFLGETFSTSTAWAEHDAAFVTDFDRERYRSSLHVRLGGSEVAYTACFDDISLQGTAYRPPLEDGPAVQVNQVGYLPEGPKNATVVTGSEESQPWQLEQAGAVVASGMTTPAGVDLSSQFPVHTIDFSEVRTPGEGFTLTVDGITSRPFTIGAERYQSLRTDAFRFFYTNRSGIEIDGAVAGAEYARPAGHIGVAPNQGDTSVPCQPPQPYTGGWTCDYTLDVTGGWYDAGDHGKYVVNGGIATWQLLSTWERARQEGGESALSDGSLAIPEQGNGVPDILDEARWSLEFLLAMQVPEGEPLAGMVHHKVQDATWTGLPLLPHADPEPRQLHRPSTAATLNLAAVAAQGARVYQSIDPEFAAELLAAARTAYAAAEDNPVLLAPQADGEEGGGAYADDDVSDEFYWAAAELFLTTNESNYRDAVLDHPLHVADVFTAGGFYWGDMAMPARLDLARFGEDLPDVDRVRRSVIAAADELAQRQQLEAFGQAYTPEDGLYVWGSNSSVLNNQVVLATAFDLTADPTYARVVLESMDYLLGRNALGISYVTGYGTVYAQNQHSRWYAASLDADLPNPPVGSIAGGPNSSLQDPIASQWLAGCAPQTCYVDDIEAWSVNEITVNWNSALAWVASFVADLGDGAPASGTLPVILDHPADVRVTPNRTAVFEVVTEGDPAPTVTWETSADGGTTWQPRPTGTTSGSAGSVEGTLRLVDVSRSQHGLLVRAMVANGHDRVVTSEVAVLRVGGGPLDVRSRSAG